jgi:hypothetical protein
MTQTVLGKRGSKRRHWTALVPLVVALALGLYWIAGAQAVHDATGDFFELGPGPAADEGGLTNILGYAGTNGTEPDGVGPDWSDLFNADGTKKKTGGDVNKADCEENGTQGILNYGATVASPGFECAFIADPSSAGGATDPTTFSGFGTSNKNNDPISGPAAGSDCAVRQLTAQQCTPWGWDKGNVPAKDDLTNVYAYEVINPANGHVIVYGGLEREDPSGDSYVDLEFFQNPVDVCRNAQGAATPTCFTGVRKDGDVIVSMNFVQGGGIGSVEVRKFSEANNSYGNPVGAASGQGCFNKNGGSGDDICAFNNGGNIDGGPWPNYDNHGKLITTLQANAFTEMGVDLTAVLGESPCISTFMGKTRSSASFTSELKDFAGPTSFSNCRPSTALTKAAQIGTITFSVPVTYTYRESNDGIDPLTPPTSGDKNSIVTDDTCSPVTYQSGDTLANNILDPGETWVLTCSKTYTSAGAKTNIATGHGLDPRLSNKDVTYCASADTTKICDPDERATKTVTITAPSAVDP